MFCSEEYMQIENVQQMRQIALKSGLRSCLFRSICWRVSCVMILLVDIVQNNLFSKIFLQCLPEKSCDHLAEIRKLRSKYEDIKTKYRQDPRMAELASQQQNVIQDNPLSQDETVNV